MSVTIRIPAPLRKLTKGANEVQCSGASVKELLNSLESSYPGFMENLCDETGKLQPFINLYVNDEDVRHLKELDTPIKDGDRISIVPAIAGGSR